MRADNNRYIFWGCIAIFVIAWTLVPVLVRNHIPLDSLETVTWGTHFAWGYDRNPYFNAWYPTLFVLLMGSSDWVIYFAGRLSIVLGLWSVWRLSKEIFPAANASNKALVAVLIAMSMPYYTEGSVDVSDNVLSVGFWGLSVYFFYMAVTYQRLKYWLFTGIACGLLVMIKYVPLLLLFSMALFLLVNKRNHYVFKDKGLYIALLIFMIIVTPHLLWIMGDSHESVNWALKKLDVSTWSGHGFDLINHIMGFGKFILLILLGMAGGILVMLMLLIKKRTAVREDVDQRIPFYQHYLFWVVIVPFLLLVMIALIGGRYIYPRWLLPFPLFFGVVFIYFYHYVVDKKALLKCVAIITTAILISYSIYYQMTPHGQSLRAFYPGKEVAVYIDKEWSKRFDRALPIIVGERWAAGSIAFYSQFSPLVYIEDNPNWFYTDDKQVKQQGAIFVWEDSHAFQLENWQKRFGQLNDITQKVFLWDNKNQDIKIKLNFAYLAPQSALSD